MAEGARLEIACTVKNGTEGSNPSLSAIHKAAQGAVSHAMQRCEPRQARKGAAVNGTLHVYVRHGPLFGLFP